MKAKKDELTTTTKQDWVVIHLVGEPVERNYIVVLQASTYSCRLLLCGANGCEFKMTNESQDTVALSGCVSIVCLTFFVSSLWGHFDSFF